MNPLSLAVIIPFRASTTRHVADLNACVASVLASISESEPEVLWSAIRIVLVDDYSPRPVAGHLLRELESKVDIIANVRTRGQAGALNSACSTVSADIFAFVDSDCIVAPGWIRAWGLHYRIHPGCIGVAGPNWFHAPAASRWARVLTTAESRLMRYMFLRYVDAGHGTTGRVDCRSLSLRASFLGAVFLDGDIFPEGLGPSVSGQFSGRLRRLLKGSGTAVCYDSTLMTVHRPVESVWFQIRRSFRFGRDGEFWREYASNGRSLGSVFVKRYLRDHFVGPWRQGRCPLAYVVLMNGAFWIGIALRSREARRDAARLPRDVAQFPRLGGSVRRLF
jgi:glycosyltransferase involved in cell wall biosynthesis